MLTKSFLLLHQLIKLRLLYTIMTPSTSLCERYHLIINQLVYFDIDYHSDISFFFTIKCKNTWAWYWLFKHSPDCQVLLRGTCGLVNGGGSTGAMSSDGSRKLLSGLAMARVRWCLGLEAPGLWEAMGESVVEVKIGKVTWSWIQDSTLVPLLALKNVAGLLLRILMASTLGWWQTLALACSQSLRHPSSHHLASMCDHLDHLTQCHHLDQLTLGRLRDLVPLPVVQRIKGRLRDLVPLPVVQRMKQQKQGQLRKPRQHLQVSVPSESLGAFSTLKFPWWKESPNGHTGRHRNLQDLRETKKEQCDLQVIVTLLPFHGIHL